MARISFVHETTVGGSQQRYSMQDLLAEFEAEVVDVPTRGAKIRARVIAENKNGFWANFGGKGDGFAAKGQFDNDKLKVGDEALFEVVGNDDANGYVTLSLEGGSVWVELMAAQADGRHLTVKVQRIQYRKNTATEATQSQRSKDRIDGVYVRYSQRVSGFVPFSLLGIPSGQLASYVDQEIEVKVEEAAPEINKLIFNRKGVELARKAEQERLKEEFSKQFIETFAPGTLLKQMPVAGIAKAEDGSEYGIFIKLSSNRNGLVYRTQIPRLSEKGALSANFKEGDLVDVVVLPLREIDGRQEIALSMKAAQSLRKQEFFASLQVGDLVTGKLARQVAFGIFVNLLQDAGVDGLLHQSKFPASGELTLGAMVPVKIIAIDRDAMTIGLSMRDLPAATNHLSQ